MQKLFIYDVDDVIYELKHTIRAALKDVTGKDIHPDLWHSFNLNEVYGVDIKDIFDSFHKHDILRTGELNKQIFPVMEYMKKNNIKTKAVTARGWHPEADAITSAFFEENKIGIDEIHVVQHHEKKSDYISQIKGFEIVGYIDDNARHIKETREACGTTIKNYFLMDQPWNRSYDVESGVTRLQNLSDVPNHLDLMLGSENTDAVKKRKIFMPK
jgi:uncharacterized HAD superfamily protein